MQRISPWNKELVLGFTKVMFPLFGRSILLVHRAYTSKRGSTEWLCQKAERKQFWQNLQLRLERSEGLLIDRATATSHHCLFLSLFKDVETVLGITKAYKSLYFCVYIKERICLLGKCISRGVIIFAFIPFDLKSVFFSKGLFNIDMHYFRVMARFPAVHF